jgi:hypothetical protein
MFHVARASLLKRIIIKKKNHISEISVLLPSLRKNNRSLKVLEKDGLTREERAQRP